LVQYRLQISTRKVAACGIEALVLKNEAYTFGSVPWKEQGLSSDLFVESDALMICEI
jgi:hypothetical protein